MGTALITSGKVFRLADIIVLSSHNKIKKKRNRRQPVFLISLKNDVIHVHFKTLDLTVKILILNKERIGCLYTF